MEDADTEARRLYKHFGGVLAVRDLSFTVSAGEVVGYVGANGSGKREAPQALAERSRVRSCPLMSLDVRSP